VVPASQYLGTRASGSTEGVRSEDDEIPHARGPEEIGMEDTGPQVARSIGMGMQSIDVEAAVGRRAEGSKETAKNEEAPTTPKREADEEMRREGKKIKDDSAPLKEEQATKSELAKVGADVMDITDA
jgi:hypothetical protein